MNVWLVIAFCATWALTMAWAEYRSYMKGFDRGLAEGRAKGYEEGFAIAKGIYSNRGPIPTPAPAKTPSPKTQAVALNTIRGHRPRPVYGDAHRSDCMCEICQDYRKGSGNS